MSLDLDGQVIWFCLVSFVMIVAVVVVVVVVVVIAVVVDDVAVMLLMETVVVGVTWMDEPFVVAVEL